MYPLKAILISSNEATLQVARRVLLNRPVHIEAEFANVGDATNALRRSTAEKRVLVLQMGSSSDLDALGRLTALLPGWPVIAMVEGYDPSSSLGAVVIGIMRAGASEIVSLPIQAEELGAALERVAVQFVYSVRESKVIAVAGVTGGAGATTVALNLAYEVADRHGLRCVLADLSLRMGVVASHLNIEPARTITDLLHDPGRIDTDLAQQALTRVTENFEILAGPHRLLAPASTSARDLALVVDTLGSIADVVVLDVPCTYDDIYFETLAAADQTILIGEQKLPSIRALKMVREALRREGGTEHLVLNKFDPATRGFEVKRLLKPLEVPELLTVARDDLGMRDAMTKACTLRLSSPRSPALADIVALADAALALETPLRVKPVGLLRRLGRAFANS